jgi:cytochrome oxidase Cu insertion factor (SCO1/SenC/PrrC family)
MALGIGLVLAVIFTVCFVGFKFALNHYGGVADPDARLLDIAPDQPRALVDFSLTDQMGRTVTQGDFAGKYLVVDFIFTSCTITCPVVSRQMAEIQTLTAGEPDVRLVSLTVDPADDTVEVLRQYGAGFDADPGRWSFLTGNEAVIHRLIAVSFLAPDTASQYAYMPGNFAHTDRIALVDPQGRVRSYFNGLNAEAADAVAAAIKRLRASPP